MSRANDAHVSPDVLRWARLSARLDETAAAKKVAASVERLESWESGELCPTVRQARTLANAYRIPFAALFLPQPPHSPSRIPRDLRRHAGEISGGPSSEIQRDVREAWNRREIALELIESNGLRVTAFPFSASLSEDTEGCGLRLRRVLGVQIDEQRKWRDPRVGFNAWRQSVEAIGVLVLQTSDLPASEIRAYSLSANELPVVVVNRKDPYAARAFSLLHELVHLGLQSDGLCDLRTDDSRPPEEQRLEVFCNAVAASALIPRATLLELADHSDQLESEWNDLSLAAMAREFACSREALLRRLLTLGMTTEAFYQAKREQYRQEYAQKQSKGGVVPPAVDAVSLLGKPLVRLVLESLSNDRITSSDAAEYLGVRLKHLPAIAAAVRDVEP
jgi:Zn-dependent peptidase ImmA (M78 family)